MEKNKMMKAICDEIDIIADKGITMGNLDTAYKLIDMYKDLKTVDAMEEAGYSETMAYENYPLSMDGESMARGRGRYARRDSRGRYSNDGMNDGMSNKDYADRRYSQAKMDYRNSRAGKNDVMESLNEKMRELRNELKEMSRDSDFPEERQQIEKYIQMIDKLM